MADYNVHPDLQNIKKGIPLPKGIKPTDVNEARLFGSSLHKSDPKDHDIALFVRPDHPIFKKEDTDALPGHIQVGKHDYSIFKDHPLNRDLFEDFAKGKYSGKGTIWRTIPEELYNKNAYGDKSYSKQAVNNAILSRKQGGK